MIAHLKAKFFIALQLPFIAHKQYSMRGLLHNLKIFKSQGKNNTPN